MADIILDTNILAELIDQYYNNLLKHGDSISPENSINSDVSDLINTIIKWHSSAIEVSYPGVVIASSFAFVEIARKYYSILEGKVSLEQFAAFIDQPPDWLFISDLDDSLYPQLLRVPAEISMPNGDVKPIEWADAIHVATALSRDDPWFLATIDSRIKQISFIKENLI